MAMHLNLLQQGRDDLSRIGSESLYIQSLEFNKAHASGQDCVQLRQVKHVVHAVAPCGLRSTRMRDRPLGAAAAITLSGPAPHQTFVRPPAQDHFMNCFTETGFAAKATVAVRGESRKLSNFSFAFATAQG